VRWLLDTNVVSESIQPRPNRAVVAWIARQPDDLMAISMATLAELRHGAAANPNEQRRGELMQWLDVTVASWLGERTLPVTLEILMDWLDVGRRLARQGMTRNSADLLIAATARLHNLTIVSRNVPDFAGTGVVVYDPWTSETHRMEQA
jgi:predicted nucleic acid-binding protein